MNSAIECPICMDAIDMAKNNVTTECGHCFHASCLMKNVAHNGFGCPYCRSIMAEAEVEKEYEDEEDDDDEYDDEDEEEENEDYALRGMRFMFNNLHGDQHEEEDIEDEDEYEQNDVAPYVEDDVVKPPVSFISQKLREQGLRFETLVKALLSAHSEYDCDDDINRTDNELFGRLRTIISNYEDEEVNFD